MFSNFGKIVNINIRPNGIAYVLFQDYLSAFFAQSALNDLKLNDVDVKINVQLCVCQNMNEDESSKIIESDEKLKDKFVVTRMEEFNTSIFKYITVFEIGVENKEFDVFHRALGLRVKKHKIYEKYSFISILLFY